MKTSDSPDTARMIADLLVRVYELHEHMIGTTGGIEGLRDATALHAAVARPFATFAGRDLYSNDFDKAAALFHSLVKSHPFMDATKRTAFAATLYFLEIYGHPRPRILPEDEVIRFCLAVAEENAQQFANTAFQPITVAEIAAWFRQLLESPDIT
jgi:death-on-curing family protein